MKTRQNTILINNSHTAFICRRNALRISSQSLRNDPVTLQRTLLACSKFFVRELDINAAVRNIYLNYIIISVLGVYYLCSFPLYHIPNLPFHSHIRIAITDFLSSIILLMMVFFLIYILIIKKVII